MPPSRWLSSRKARIIANMIRNERVTSAINNLRFLHKAGAKQFFKLLVSAVALIDPDGRVLLARRPEGKPLAGLWEFPGGKVDAADAEGAASAAMWSAFEPRLVRALLRELREELALDLDAVAVMSVRHLGIALTPPPAPIRFNTHFFAIELRERPALTPDAHEIAELQSREMGQPITLSRESTAMALAYLGDVAREAVTYPPAIAHRLGKTPRQVALAFLTRDASTFTIPKAEIRSRVETPRSVMPEGLMRLLTGNEQRNLIALLQAGPSAIPDSARTRLGR